MDKIVEDAVFFWMPDEQYGSFSQWYPKPFVVDGELYYTAEHWMMASKAAFFGDLTTRALIMEEPNPEKVRDLGRQIKPFDSKEWAKHSYEIVLKGNRVKFAGPELKKKMLDTGKRLLVEASPHDRLWGIGYDADHATRNHETWGQNLMGKVMMQIRDELRANTSNM